MNRKKSKIDHIIVSKNLDTEELNLHKSISDHKILSVVINNIEEVQRNRVKLINRNLSMKITQDSLKSATSLQKFFENHQNECRTHKRQLRKKIKKNIEYKKELRDIFEDADYSFDIIRKELSLKWKNLWREIEKLRFELNPKEAFQKLQVITKYHAFEKRDGSIISKVKVDGATFQSPEQVNIYLKQSLQNLCGNDQASTLTKSTIFPHLPKLTIIELRQIVTKLSKKKAIAEDFCEDSVLWENILKDNNIA